MTEANARLIALAPEMRDTLKALEQRALGCPECYAFIGEEAHTPDCRLGTLLKNLEGL